ncbi:hypothetical protein ACFV7Q_09735 [Streptomyces sp. NPDC059851]|uniref:hypothetical protein n=1 Tax=Streptomyces sp. NPDC059851 TaxID=3346971 RepID=UPI00364713E3
MVGGQPVGCARWTSAASALMEAKAAGEAVEKAEPPAQPTGVVDLMEALRASVERARSPKDTGGQRLRHRVREEAGREAAHRRARALLRCGP